MALNAVARAGMVAWRYYQLKDEAQQLVVFGAAVPTSTLKDQILEKADELNVPLDPADIEVRRDQNRTSVEAYYTEDLEYFPSFVYPVDLTLSVESIGVAAIPH